MCIPARTETDFDKDGISEAILAAVWNEQIHLRGPMWDCRGRPVAVVYRGKWTAGSGPDFEGAMLQLGEDSPLARGSVEIHLRCADWWAHGHHEDPRYNDVALHVVLWPQSARPVTRADGVAVPTLVLADYITLSASELVEKVSPLVANLGTLSEEPCWQRTQGWPLEKLLSILDTAGDSRLLSKAAVMESELDVYGSPDEVFYRGLMDSLGYSSNREPMKALASMLPVSSLLTLPLPATLSERASLLEAVLLGAGGLLPSQRPDLDPLDYLSSEYAGEVEALWHAHAPLLGLSFSSAVTGWKVDRVRPANSPPRRVAAAARLLARLLWEPGGMLAPFVSVSHLPAKELVKRWPSLLSVPAEGYWASHSDFGTSLSGAQPEVALVGESRANDMVVNILLPLLIAHAERTPAHDLREKALAAYAAYPKLAENNVTRAMVEEAFGPRKTGAIKGARQQQGMIHLYRLYCQVRRCYECPLSGVVSFELLDRGLLGRA